MFTNGMLAHRNSRRPLDALRTGAGSFKRMLGSGDQRGRFLALAQAHGASDLQQEITSRGVGHATENQFATIL